MQVGDLVKRKMDDGSGTGWSDLTKEEQFECGIVAEIERPESVFEDRPKSILLVVHWSFTGLSWEDPENIEAWQ